MTSARWPYHLAVGAGVGVLTAHTLLFSSWMIDDAGISFAYARNLAGGHGFVAQPDRPPVEGFSNPLWTLLIALSYATGTFSLSLTPKLIAFAMVLGVFYFIGRDLRSRGASAFAVGIPLLVLAGCTPFVIWTTSGLENALLALIVVGACVNTIRAVTHPARGVRAEVTAGVLAALLALVRPDAILYVAAHPAAVVFAEMRKSPRALAGVARRLAAMALAFIPVFGAYLAFRVVYFGSWVPNTYYAKQKPSLEGLASPGKLFDLIESASGDFAWIVPFYVLATLGVLVAARRLENRTFALLLHLAIASAIYLVMPPDWMGEFRFATAFFPLFFWSMSELAVAATQGWQVPQPARRAFAAAVVVFAVQAFIVFGSRSLTFVENPPVPLAVIQHYGAAGFGQLASLARVERPSVLTSDLGGMLLDSPLTVHDLAGLCDKTIARSLSISGNPARLHDYVFEEIKPTFIHVVGTFVRLSRFHDDPRFSRDYVAIHESWAAPPEWTAIWQGRGRAIPPFLGDYVRRDALDANPHTLEALRDAYRRQRMERSIGTWRPRRDGIATDRPLTAAATRRLYGYLSNAADMPNEGF